MIIGVDEVGRGPLVGDVVAAAVCLPENRLGEFTEITDSKKLTAKKRERLASQIMEHAAVSIGRASPQEIDQINVLQASLLAMKRAVDGLFIAQPALRESLIEIRVDGNQLPKWSYPSRAVVGGDATELCIGAASIVAKVARDADMIALAKQYPQYAFERHKGYPTAAHIQALQDFGILSTYYRLTFKPVAQLLQQQRLNIKSKSM